MPLISVVIPAYNAADCVGRAVEAVLAQTMDAFEIIVSDDGSTDQTKQAVGRYRSDPRLRYIRNGNGGPSYAKNRAAELCTGEFVLFLDADDSLAPTALETLYHRFKRAGASWGIVGVLKVEGSRKTVRPAWVPEGDFLLSLLEDDIVSRSPFYPLKEFMSIGMYDEGLLTREDWDINIRMAAAERPYVVIDEPLYVYTRTEGSLTTGNRRRVLLCTEKLLCKHHKRLADAGDERIAHIYASNMWDLARSYVYELKDRREALRCMRESLRYDKSVYRLVHPVIHRFNAVARRWS